MKSSIFRALRQGAVSLLCLSILASSGTAFASSSLSWYSSSNWSGYAATGNTFNKVQAEITVPTVTCTTANADSLFWVGFDGYTNSTVEQDGVEAKCTTANKAPTYYAWWEMYNATGGTSIHRITNPNFSVHPNDSIIASATYNPTNKTYVLVLDNLTIKRTYTETLTGYARTRQSAEWVVERYDNGNDNFTPLAKFNYNAKLFTNAEASTSTNSKLEPISYFNSVQGINMISSTTNHQLDTTHAYTNGGTTFGVTWQEAL